jgi:hypothetical protein
MATKAEIANAVLKGLGRRPTRFLFRWEPTWKNPFRFGLLEVSKCETDGGVVTPTMSQRLRPLHAGHKIKDPKMYSIIEFLGVQIRLIR